MMQSKQQWQPLVTFTFLTGPFLIFMAMSHPLLHDRFRTAAVRRGRPSTRVERAKPPRFARFGLAPEKFFQRPERWKAPHLESLPEPWPV